MAIDMLFTKTDDALEGLLPNNFKEDQNVWDGVLPKVSTDLKSFRNESEKSSPIVHLIRMTVQLLFYLAAFTFLAFTLTVVLTNWLIQRLNRNSRRFLFLHFTEAEHKTGHDHMNFYILFVEW